MKKSRVVKLGLLLSMAASLAACRQGPAVAQRCVSDDGTVVKDWNCDDEDSRRASGSGVYVPHYHWYYGGYGNLGTRVGGGSYTEPQGAAIMRPNSGGAVVKGGSSIRGFFGGTGSGHSVTS